MRRIDAHTDELIRQTNAEIGGDSIAPNLDRSGYYPGEGVVYPGRDVEQPPTVNPAATDLAFRMAETEEDYDAVAEATEALERLESPQEPSADALHLDLSAALQQAIRTGREYKTAEEEYVLGALRLLIERHQWGPRFFNDVSATINGIGDDALFDTSLRIVNEFRVTQRLPYGGEVSARLLARATEDLHLRVAGENVQTSDLILSGNIPLLRGAGQSARESRIQAERNLVYAARSFERFRRTYLFDIARDFLDLVVEQRNINNSQNELESRLRNLEREQALARAGREAPFRAALAENDVLDTRDRLRNQIDNYRFSIDQFTVTLGLPVNTEIVIVPDELALPSPELDEMTAVETALANRLDLQTRRDGVADSRRDVDNSRNNVLADLDLSGSVSFPSDDERNRAGFRLNSEDASFAVGVTYGLPLDREIERLQLRQSQINFEQAKRNYDRSRDDVVVEVRQAIRQIRRAEFSLRLQEKNYEIARLRQANIDAAPDRATALERSDAADALTSAANRRDAAERDLRVAILGYLLSTGTLRVNSDGTLIRLPGMPEGGP